MTTQPIIEVHGLSAGYDGRTVLHDIDLTVYENDFLGIIGPNGGGKTTLSNGQERAPFRPLRC